MYSLTFFPYYFLIILFLRAKLQILCEIKEHLFPKSPFHTKYLKQEFGKIAVPLHPNLRDNEITQTVWL